MFGSRLQVIGDRLLEVRPRYLDIFRLFLQAGLDALGLDRDAAPSIGDR
jgi:hypothetical protein